MDGVEFVYINMVSVDIQTKSAPGSTFIIGKDQNLLSKSDLHYAGRCVASGSSHKNVKGRFLCKHGCNFVSNHTILHLPTFRLNK